jgi:acetoin utilization protein AcuC
MVRLVPLTPAVDQSPLLVYGPRSRTYDFGPGHPLTPRRFGPGIHLLELLGAEAGLAPEPAPDDELLWCHTRLYVDAIRRFSADPSGPPAVGVGPGDDPAFAGMHEAGAAVAGGSIRAVEAILRGDVRHAFHPGGGLHHAMPGRASGFCIYDDVALAIARARRDGLRVLYLDLDVHHGDGVQAIHWSDPGVMTVSVHETGMALFPGTGFASELGEAASAGSKVNVPLDPGTGAQGWLGAVRTVIPEVAAAFGPDLVVSQHGCDSHAWDPLAHLRVTTTAMGAAARLIDRIAHRWADGRWLATGGGGYDAYRVVPRAWSLVWLAAAHRASPGAIPAEFAERWATEAARYGASPLPTTFEDPEEVGRVGADQHVVDGRALAVAAEVREIVIPTLLRAASDRGWWTIDDEEIDLRSAVSTRPTATTWDQSVDPVIAPELDAAAWSRLRLAERVLSPARTDDAHALVHRALQSRDRVWASAALVGDVVVGAVLSFAPDEPGRRRLLAIGVAPAVRRRGIAAALLAAHLGVVDTEAAMHVPARIGVEAVVTVAERDVVDPLPAATRAAVARHLLEDAGFRVERAGGVIGRIDAGALVARRG